jgi:hypothetical protein
MDLPQYTGPEGLPWLPVYAAGYLTATGDGISTCIKGLDEVISVFPAELIRSEQCGTSCLGEVIEC